MDFPFGHNHHHPHHTQDSNTFPPPPFPPQPSYDGAYPHAPPPPPPQVPGVHHISHQSPHLDSPNYPPPPQPPHLTGVHHTPNYPPPPPPPEQPPYEHHEHESHNQGGGFLHFSRPHMPSFIQGHLHHQPEYSHQSSDVGGLNSNYNSLEGYFANKPTYRIYCKASGTTFCVAIRHNKVVLTFADPNDPTQHWYKDEKYSTKVKDEDGYPSFSLVNKATGQAMKHPISGEPVELVPYKPDHLDGSLLWTESKDLGSGYRTVRNVNNVKMVLDAFNGDKDHGGVHDGTFLSIFKCWKGDNQNQQWKISPY